MNNEDRDNIFGNRLKKLRRDTMNLTQIEFSELLGIAQPSLSAYESGKTKPTIDVVIQIAEKCNVSIDWLCGRDNVSRLNSMGDFISMMYDMYDAREFSCKTEIHDRIDIEGKNRDDDTTRNWVRLTFYYNEFRYDPALTYSATACRAITEAYKLHDELVNYDCSQEYYNNQKAANISYYGDLPVTHMEMPEISEDERIERRIARLKAEWEKNKK